MTFQTKRLTTILLVVAGLLMIPLVAMQFSTEVNWSFSDFIVMGGLLLGTGLLIDLVLRKVQSFQNRLLLIGGVLVLLFLIWAELAVGIFGTPFAGS